MQDYNDGDDVMEEITSEMRTAICEEMAKVFTEEGMAPSEVRTTALHSFLLLAALRCSHRRAVAVCSTALKHATTLAVLQNPALQRLGKKAIAEAEEKAAGRARAKPDEPPPDRPKSGPGSRGGRGRGRGKAAKAGEDGGDGDGKEAAGGRRKRARR